MAQPIDLTATSAKSERSKTSKPISAKTIQASTAQTVTDVIEAQQSRRKKSSNAADASVEQAIIAASQLNDQPKPFTTSASVSPMRLAKPTELFLQCPGGRCLCCENNGAWRKPDDD